MEFHISRKARDLYQLDDSLFTFSGNAILPNFQSARLLAQKMNEKEDRFNSPKRTIQAWQINAMGLIDEILHYIVKLYRQEKNQKIMKQALDFLYKELGPDPVKKALKRFIDEFPTVAIYRNEIKAEAYLMGETHGISNLQITLEEMLMLWLANRNAAFSPFSELFDDLALEKETSYSPIMEALHSFFEHQPFFGPDLQNLIDMLRSPALAVPHSLSGQLEYIRDKWGYLLGPYLLRLLQSLDLMKEEEIALLRKGIRWERPPIEVHEYLSLADEPERFSSDLEWMPKLVLMAKNIHVWLHQLSLKYHRPIQRLDQIPDDELNLLADWGMTGLWLIGIWERSPASKRIKELLGDQEAIASAYSIFDYQIAGDLGGEEAFKNLKARAWKFGIRMACDMVPNHMGLDSKWVLEHPDWFLSLNESPFPSYRFNGPDLSWHGEVGIFLEDHYFDRSDAAVVFKRVEWRSGEERYIYHGNDGTRMPWNDTAQLNYLIPEVREAVIQTILQVAQRFPIIRFDAAMTLTKMHYQRLWFPEPGTGGAIPSRAEYGMPKEQFHQLMPEEFWREVVDRVTQEAPDTLLLAEAFWLLEGYFVRTLGMHRVYNSAFMNMLKNEENAKYRSVIKNTLEFNPEILKRFVNFMSNPDEETAINQFGKGDKYFGICTLMVTLPGLPMFAHGQIEGLSEKYGMEYRYTKWNESPDPELIKRHEREIFPLLKRRYLFADMKNFLFYDFFTPEGYVNENVFAYSNRMDQEKVLVIYHNKYERAHGWIRTSVAYSAKGNEGENRIWIQKTLGEGLGLTPHSEYFSIFRDPISGLEFIRNSKELFDKGLYVELGAYQYHVFIDFKEVRDNPWHHYAQITQQLNGRGVPSIEEALKRMRLQPLHQTFRRLVNKDTYYQLRKAWAIHPQISRDEELSDEIEKRVVDLLCEVKNLTGGEEDVTTMAREVRQKLEVILYLPTLTSRYSSIQPKEIKKMAEFIHQHLNDSFSLWGTLLSWLFVHILGKGTTLMDFPKRSRFFMDEWRLGEIITEVLRDLGVEEQEVQKSLWLIKLLTHHQRWFEEKTADQVLVKLFKDNEVQLFLKMNRSKNQLWFNKESFEELLGWLMLIAAIEIGSDPIRPINEMMKELKRAWLMIQKLEEAKRRSEYQVEKLLISLKE